MPELPEVEVMTRALNRWAAGRVIVDVVLHDEKLLGDDDSHALLDELRDHPAALHVRRGWRRAKYAVLDLEQGSSVAAAQHSLVLHFRMTGLLRHREAAAPATRGARLSLLLDDDHAVDFADLRRLGQAWLLPTLDLPAFFADRKLGPEPWPDRQDGAWWQARFRGLRGPIKPALLRQDRVAGIGNIIASECLWRAGIDPTCLVPQLSATAWQRLADAVPAFIDNVVQTEGAAHDRDGFIDYVNLGGPNPFDVYGRAGEACPRCSTPIERLVQSGRGTWCCPSCQGGGL